MGYNVAKYIINSNTNVLLDLNFCLFKASYVMRVTNNPNSYKLFPRYVVDATNKDTLSIAKGELHDLRRKPSLHGIPLLVLGNRINQQPKALSKQTFIIKCGTSSTCVCDIC